MQVKNVLALWLDEDWDPGILVNWGTIGGQPSSERTAVRLLRIGSLSRPRKASYCSMSLAESHQSIVVIVAFSKPVIISAR